MIGDRKRGRPGVFPMAVMCALAAAGCTGELAPDETAAPRIDAPVMAQTAGLPPIPVPAPPRPQPAHPRVKTPAPPAKPVEDPAPPTTTAPTSPPLAVRLKGLSEAEAEALLGRPAAVEEKAPARVWVYRAKACSLRVAFFPQMATLDFRVLSVELSEKGDAAARSRCEADLLAAHGGVGA